MLSQILGIKKRREGKIRSQLAILQRSLDENQRQQEVLAQEKVLLYHEWRHLSHERRRVPEGELPQVQEVFDQFYQRDREIMRQQSELQKEFADLLERQEQQRHKLQRNRVEQEKLNYVMENEQ